MSPFICLAPIFDMLIPPTISPDSCESSFAGYGQNHLTAVRIEAHGANATGTAHECNLIPALSAAIRR